MTVSVYLGSQNKIPDTGWKPEVQDQATILVGCGPSSRILIQWKRQESSWGSVIRLLIPSVRLC